jgi:hypothetical protein
MICSIGAGDLLYRYLDEASITPACTLTWLLKWRDDVPHVHPRCAAESVGLKAVRKVRGMLRSSLSPPQTHQHPRSSVPYARSSSLQCLRVPAM